MSGAVAVVNVVLGLAYCGYGVVTLVEMARDWRTFGFSHFGAAWACMAFTCGPHHLVHGVHVGLEGRSGGPLDLVSVVVGLPVGVLWLYLRLEAFAGGRGDRFLPATPWWLRAGLPAGGAYVLALGVVAAPLAAGEGRPGAGVVANAALIAVYLAIGWFVLRTQLANHPTMGGWSVSGLCLSAIFPTCAVMHGVWAAYALAGRYHDDGHGLVVDWLSIPAGLYFLWVVRRLCRDALGDWNEGPDQVTAPVSLDGRPAA